MSSKSSVLFLVAILFSLTASAGSQSRPLDPCSEAHGWRAYLCDFARKNLKHTAWGFEHAKRDYLVASELAHQDGLPIQDDILFAAAMLHDMGGFAPYAVDGVDHALRSTQVVDTILKPSGFDMEKSEAVKQAILTHSYYCPDRPQTPEAVALHDADTIDFMGSIAVTRIFSIVGREQVAPDLASAFRLLKSFETLPTKIYGGPYAQRKAADRARELGRFLDHLKNESFELNSL